MLRPRAQYARTTPHCVVVIRRHYTTAKPGTICHIVSREITLIHDINDLPLYFVAASYVLGVRALLRNTTLANFSICRKKDS